MTSWSPPESHQSNGIAERKIRTLETLARACLNTAPAVLPMTKLYQFAIKYSNHCSNILLAGYKDFTGKSPNLRKLMPWGSLIVVENLEQQPAYRSVNGKQGFYSTKRDKIFENPGIHAFFMGISPNNVGIQAWTENSGLLIRRHAKLVKPQPVSRVKSTTANLDPFLICEPQSREVDDANLEDGAGPVYRDLAKARSHIPHEPDSDTSSDEFLDGTTDDVYEAVKTRSRAAQSSDLHINLKKPNSIRRIPDPVATRTSMRLRPRETNYGTSFKRDHRKALANMQASLPDTGLFPQESVPANKLKRLNESLEFVQDSLITPLTYKQAIKLPESKLWLEAVNREHQSLIKSGTMIVVDRPTTRQVIPLKPVFKIKRDNVGRVEKFKCRYVAKGFYQVAGEDFFEVRAPVVTPVSLRIFLAIAAANHYFIKQYDMETAFLHADLEEEVFVEIPKEFNIHGFDKVWKLLKSLYGLRQAPRYWSKLLCRFFASEGFVQCLIDECLFVKESTDGKPIIIVFHVDDIKVGAPKLTDIEYLFKAMIAYGLKAKHISDPKLFLQMNVSYNQDQGIFHLGQETYINSIVTNLRKGLNLSRDLKTPMETSFKVDQPASEMLLPENSYRKHIGELTYVVSQTRPDAACAVNMLAQASQDPRKCHRKAALRVYSYLDFTKHYRLTFGNITNKNLEAFVDVSHAPEKKHSREGLILFFNGSPIDWVSKKQTGVSTASTEGEYKALTLACHRVIAAKTTLEHMGVEVSLPIPIYCDNTGAIIMSDHPTAKSRHIFIHFHYVRELVELGIVRIEYISTHDQIADILTKPLPVHAHEKLCASIFANQL
jgi:hypothetical protein